MKKTLLIFLLILIFPVCSALYEKVIYNGWVKSGYDFVIQNETYVAYYIKDTNTSVFYLPDEVTTVIDLKNATCTTEWLYKICQTKLKFERGKFEVPSYINDPNINISMYIKIEKTDASLKINRSFDNTFFLGDEEEIQIILEKNGAVAISNISFVDNFPASFAVTPVFGCSARKNSAFWTGELNEETKYTCIYRVRALKEGTYTNSINLSYTLFGKTENKVTNYTLKVIASPLDLRVNYPNRSKVGAPVNISSKLKALSQVKIENIEAEIPSDLDILNLSKLNNKFGILTFGGIDLQENKSHSFSYIVNSSSAGFRNFNVTINYVYKGLLKKLRYQLCPDFQYESRQKGKHYRSKHLKL